jgi:hypothetical protein
VLKLLGVCSQFTDIAFIPVSFILCSRVQLASGARTSDKSACTYFSLQLDLTASCAAFYTNPWVPVVTAGPRPRIQRICAGPLFPALFLQVFCWTREGRSPILRSYTAFPLTFQQHSQISSRILGSHFVDAIRFHASLVCLRRVSPILTSSVHASYFL